MSGISLSICSTKRDLTQKGTAGHPSTYWKPPPSSFGTRLRTGGTSDMILHVLNDRNCPASPGTHAARLRRALEQSGSQGMSLCSTGHISERWDPQQRAPVHPGVLLSRGNLREVLGCESWHSLSSPSTCIAGSRLFTRDRGLPALWYSGAFKHHTKITLKFVKTSHFLCIFLAKTHHVSALVQWEVYSRGTHIWWGL